MDGFLFRKLSLSKQYIFSLLFIFVIAGCCYLLSDFVGYRVVALILMLSVSIIAMFFDMKPVLLVAVLSALTWNFFFIPPKFTLAIRGTEDNLMFLMYFVIAMVNAVLTSKIRQMETEVRNKEEKENTLKLYNTVLNSLSHELRTPISTIIGATDNLQTMSKKLTESDKYELVSEISKASMQLNRQVGNLLNMSRLESGFIKPKTDWFDIKELIYDVLNQMEDTVKDKPVHVAVDENTPLFKLDYGLLSQVIHNLVHNAVTYIPTHAVITIRAFCKDKKLVLVVEDTGNGFPETEKEKVFEKFYKLKHSGTGGTGLGLSIVKGFVTAMDGKITLQNKTDGGAIFTIEIPSELSFVTPA
ncbi:sensor histidine kinase [Sphingobacteriaceae bacterium]|nr:sensor histidine kinase [Sphingobacteriaceae bacterium]